jgi:CRP-like cAMP-binding protein
MSNDTEVGTEPPSAMKNDPKAPLNYPTTCRECVVRSRAWFQPLAKEEVDTVQHYKSEHRVVKAGEDIIREGETCKELFTLFDGWAFTYKLLEDGRRQILKIHLPGDFLGFQADLEGPNVNSTEALTDTVVCVFPRPNMLHMFEEQPKLGISLVWMTASDQLLTHEHLTSMGRRPARDRIAQLLLEIFVRVRDRTGSTEDNIYFPLTQEHLADTTGLTSIHVNRTLKELRQEGMLDITRRRLTIPDIDRVQAEVGVDLERLIQKQKVI